MGSVMPEEALRARTASLRRIRFTEYPFLRSYILGNYLPGNDIPQCRRYTHPVPEQDGVDLILEQWRRERPDLDATPLAVIGRVSRLSRELERRLEPVFARHGLEAGLYDVLATLRRAAAPYLVRPSELAASLMLTASGMTKRLDRLEQAGLVARHPDPADRRGVLIELTPAGRQLIDSTATEHVANESNLLSALSRAERDQLASLLRKLLLGLPPVPDRAEAPPRDES
jgi:DNA-binding MarR family transcriptional regulator